ncbi:MAG: hypothetical protein ACTS6A_01245 [Candidatus Hodgkinia cicadicola]
MRWVRYLLGTPPLLVHDASLPSIKNGGGGATASIRTTRNNGGGERFPSTLRA